MQPREEAAAAAQNLSERSHEDQASFRTQAGALFRKNAAYQRRNRRSNCCITVTPIIFIMLLFIIQKVVNSAFDQPNTRCGCECLRCCDEGVNGGDEVCRDATPERPCYPGTFTGDCKKYNKSNCGPQYSDQENVAYCAIDTPSTWPPLLQVPQQQYRAEPYRPAAAFLFTGDDPTTARAIVGGLFRTANLSDAATVANVTQTLRAGLEEAPIVVNGDVISELGYTLGTSADQYGTVFYEAAFVQNLPVYSMNPTCDAAAANSSAALGSLLGNAQSNGVNFGADVVCTPEQTSFRSDAAAIDRDLFCGFYQAQCNESNPFATNAYVHAYDFGNTTRGRFALNYWYNDTNQLNATQGPPSVQRMNQGLNMAVNAFLQWSLGPQYSAALLGISEMPKPETKLTLDFASLLGPIFFSWLVQLLLPLMLVNLVYEKQQGLRIMMKMHGLGDGAYFAVQYVWFLLLYVVYMVVLIVIGSAVNIGFFRKNNYGLQILFYFVWGNCMVAFGFVLSTLLRSVKTAVVTGYLYTIGTGLLGYLLFQQLIERGYSWVWVLEIVPSFALYRGLYEFSQYAFKAGYGNGGGLGFHNLNDGYNGVPVAMGIMAIEWALFLILAWYLEQVLPSGTGVRRSPLFFLESARRRRRRRSGSVASAAHGKAAEPAGGSLSVDLEHDDVTAERDRVSSLPDDGSAPETIVVRDLRKVYPPQGGNPAKVAVKGLTLGIQRGEVFGLLGPNGAGKTSAIHMMTGFLEPTAGTALVDGLDIRQDMATIYSRMGVCPQHDLLWEQLTPTEHLGFYGRLKRLKGPELAAAVEAGLRAVNLWGVRNKRAGEFSGGMKRRLSVAISFVGSPAVVFLDEPSFEKFAAAAAMRTLRTVACDGPAVDLPTAAGQVSARAGAAACRRCTGLDPASRRNLWEVVKKARAGRGIVLTTHSMEEAEVLCDRLGIFVDGQLVCVGAPKQITARYGGYLVFTVTTLPRQADTEAADALVRQLAPGARRTYALGGTQKYELPTSEVSLSQVFAAMEQSKGSLNVLDWGVANATLEEVFIKFARQIGAEGEK